MGSLCSSDRVQYCYQLAPAVFGTLVLGESEPIPPATLCLLLFAAVTRVTRILNLFPLIYISIQRNKSAKAVTFVTL